MKQEKQIAAEILMIAKSEISEESKIELIAQMIQDYGSDRMSDHNCSENVIY